MYKRQESRLVIDHRDSPFVASIIEIYGVASDLMKFGFTTDFKGAVLFNMNKDDYIFADKVSQNWSHGILRFFSDEEIAENWLWSH